ncbi:MAG: fluoride efflux transporter CrcB [Saprospiraceae bacterium]|nr:fluoride efflux transporter CrcB [Saprospiraceae bacterium]MCF8252260.1 fluoride efflux transporter CrcB [Saprospiraceae bacterium]MCF8283089.1 fluoride efflux transporter CrcB [Bacteroidales bacterium]MCF8313911.1 fluoride efflux transporter CrcB [Saprospiraceae bacterium]MCF8443133.1 fluoride efflux transporter CrcB [Saprospiraceae bacterium]
MQTYLFVFLGGGLGSICRFGLGNWLMTSHRLQFPWATFATNVLACLILGVLVSLSMKGRLGGPMSVLLMAGFCGGFSTFSTFSNEAIQLLVAGQWFRAFAYMAASLLVCLAAIYAGMKLGRV